MSTTTANWREGAKAKLEAESAKLEGQFGTEKDEIRINSEKEKHLYPPPDRYYRNTVILYVLAQTALMFFVSLPLMTETVSIGIPVNIGIAFLLLQILHFAGSIRSVKVQDLAGFSLFGRPWYAPKTGFHVVPLGILKFIRASRNYKDVRFPGPADKIHRISREMQEKSPTGDAPPAGMVRPIFVLTGEPRLSDDDRKRIKEEDDGNPLDQQLSVEVVYFLRFRPDQDYGGIFRIARNLSAEAVDLDTHIENLIKEQSERDMKSVLSLLTPATIVENWDLVNEVFLKKVRLGAMRLGVDIAMNAGGLDDLNLSHGTNESQANAVRALFNKRTTIINAVAQRKAIEEKAAGEAYGELVLLKARAEGRELMKKKLNITGNAVLASEAVAGILEKTDVILAGGTDGVRDVMTLVKGAQSVLNVGSKTKVAKGA